MRLFVVGILLCVLLGLTPKIAQAQDLIRIDCRMIWNGANLYGHLQQDDNELGVAYVSGVVDILFVHDAMCRLTKDKGPWERPALPENLSSHQASDIVLNYLKSHPEKRKEPAAGLVIHALQLAFPQGKE